MKKQRIIEEMARLGKGDRWVEQNGDGTSYNFSDYLNSHDACQRVIDGMDDEKKQDAWNRLRSVRSWGPMMATPRQKCEAILKAYGKWEEN